MIRREGKFPAGAVLLGVAILIALGVAGRLLPHWPNFTPVVAIAVFAAFAFRSSLLAWVIPAAVMLISNLLLGGYEWGVMGSVYLALALAVVIGRASFGNGASVFSVGAASLASAVGFFIITNFAVWAFGAHGTAYPATMEGLIACYTAALPFFKYLLAGTAFWAILLFGGHALATRAMSGQRTA